MPTLHELHLLAKEYGQDPPALLGIDPKTDQMLAWQVRRATFYAGRTVENRLKETRQALKPNGPDAPKGTHWGHEPKWTWAQAVGLEPPPIDAGDGDTATAEHAERTRHEIGPDAAAALDGIS